MNVEALLEPIDGDDPCGDDLSFSREFDAIGEARRADDPTLAQGDWKKPLKAADWAGVALQCEALLKRRSKDLRVAVWLVEARSRTDGFAGLADGLLLCARLCEAWWDHGLHPRPDDGDPAPRVGSLAWLLAFVVDTAHSAPVLRAGDESFGLRDLAAAHTPQDPKTADAVARAEAATPAAFLASNAAAVRRAVDALSRLRRFVDARPGDDGPAFGAAGQALDDALLQVERFATSDAGLAAHASVDAAVMKSPAAPSGSLQSRTQALQQLRAVAEFFRRTEPHSPVGYLADKAASWGEMPLHDWLRAVLKDPGALAQIEELLGLPRPPG